MLQTIVVDNIKTYIICSINFFEENHVTYEIMWKNVVEPDRPHNSAHAPCTLDNCVLRHTLRIFNTACFSTSTIVRPTLLSVTITHKFPTSLRIVINLLKPTGHVMHQQFNIEQPYVLPTLYLCVLYLSENKQRFVPLTA